METPPDIHLFKLFSQTTNKPPTISGGSTSSKFMALPSIIYTNFVGVLNSNKSYILFAIIILSSLIILAHNSNKIIAWVKNYWNNIQLSMFLSSSGELMSTYVPEKFYSMK
jgi:hypothetical protein